MLVLNPASDCYPERTRSRSILEGRDLVSGVILSEAIAQHPRRGRISLLRNPESGLNPASDRHPEAGTIAEGSRPCLRLSSPANAIAQHPRRGGTSRYCFCLSSRANARDLGVESGPNHKRDPSAMEPPSGFLSKIKPERNQEGASSAGISPEKNRGSAASLFIHSISPVEFNSQDQHPVVDDLHYQPPVTDPVAP